MKAFRNLILFVLAVCLFSSAANAQFGYKNEHETIDGVEISYKWSQSKWWKKSSPKQLRFKMKNTNDYKVNVKFELVYLLDHVVKFKSGALEAEIKAGKALSGKLNGFYFESPAISNKQLESEQFDWEFLFFEVIPLKENG
ncbi:MAG: hypothetical protein PF448_06985 [Bacteroidales bacterium]|jgi:hypothetical protein|nr:hypothetical protein [Bacteroidales bacterium]